LTKRRKNIILPNSIAGVDEAVQLLKNDFEEIIIPEYPVIENLKKTLEAAGAYGTLMSGSGSTVFGIFKNRELAEKAVKNISLNTGHKAYLVHSL
jgi:4-diphosphocytidyl-2-C-methyl-D-erythritol kinase